MNIYDNLHSLCDVIQGSNVKNPVLISFMNPETGDCGRMVHGDPFTVLFMIDRIIEMIADKLNMNFDEIIKMMKFAHMGGENHGSFPGNL